MKLIQLGAPTRYETYVEFPYVFTMDIPQSLKNVPNKSVVAKSYDSSYDVVIINNEEYFTVTGILSIISTKTNDEIKSQFIDLYNQDKQILDTFVLQDYDSLIDKSWDGYIWV